MEKMHEVLKVHLQKSCDVQKVYYDKHHTLQMFNVGDWVLLSTKNLSTIQLAPKLDHAYTGPFQIIDTWGKQSYKLQLPPNWHSIHPVFHISLLEPYNEWEGVPRALGPEIVNGEDEWLVEEILARKSIKGIDMFLTRWYSWGPEHNTWEPEEHVGDMTAFADFIHNEKLQMLLR